MTIIELDTAFLIFALILVAIVGFIAQYIGLCMVRGVKEASAGKPVFLLAIVLSGTLAWIPALLSPVIGIEPNFRAHDINLYAIIGGLLFGAGAAFNGGCSVSTVGRLTRGELVMILTILGWLLGWLFEANFVQKIRHPEYAISISVQYPVLISLSVLLGILLLTKQKENSKIWISMLGIGLIGGILLLFEPGWTPSGMLNDISSAAWGDSGTSWPVVERYGLVISLLIGMIVAAITTRRFKLRTISISIMPRHLLAGTLMGIGGAMAGGGNDTQLLSALPSLSPAGLMAVLSMIVGIYSVNTFILNKIK